MASKVAFLLLTATLLVQCVHYTEAKPQDDPKVAEELNEISMLFTSTDNEKPVPHVQLKIAIMHECGPLFNFTIHQGKKVFQNVLKDSDVLTNPSEELEIQLAEFSQYVEVVENVEKHEERVKFLDIVEIANRMKTLVGKYDTSSLEKPSSVELLIEAALKKNGLPELKADFNKRFMDTVPKYYAKIDSYLESLSAEQREEAKKLNEWYASFKSEQDVEKKRTIFGNLFKL